MLTKEKKREESIDVKYFDNILISNQHLIYQMGKLNNLIDVLNENHTMCYAIDEERKNKQTIELVPKIFEKQMI